MPFPHLCKLGELHKNAPVSASYLLRASEESLSKVTML